MVEGLVGSQEQGFRAGFGAGDEGRDAAADGHLAVMGTGMGHLQLGHAVAHALGDEGGAAQLGVRQDDGKLLAAVAGQEVAAPLHGLGHGRSHLLQAFVTGLVAVGVVEFLEEIHVAHDDGQLRALAHGAAPFPFQSLVEHAAVGHTGEAVHGGEALQLLVGRIQLARQHQQGVAHLHDALHGADLGPQHHVADRLLQVVVTAGGDALFQVGVAAHGGEEDDGGPFARLFQVPDAPGHGVAVHVRQDHVEQHQVGAFGLEQFDGLGTAGRRNRNVAESFQMVANHSQ